MELLRDDVLPKRVDRLYVGVVAGERRDVGHAAVEIHGPYRVANRLALQRDGQMVLVVRARCAELSAVGEVAGLREYLIAAASAAAAAHLQEELREIKVPPLAGGAVEAAEGELYLLVSGRALQLVLAGAERAVYEVRRLDGDVEETALAGRLPVRDGGLVHVPGVVELVAAAEVRPAHRPHHLGELEAVNLLHAERARGVEVAVLFLRPRHPSYEPIDVGLKLLVRMSCESVRSALHDLEYVGVVEGNPLERPLGPDRGVGEVRYPRNLALLEVGLKRDEPVSLQARQPEPACHLHVCYLRKGVGVVTPRKRRQRRGKRTRRRDECGFSHFPFHLNITIKPDCA